MKMERVIGAFNFTRTKTSKSFNEKIDEAEAMGNAKSNLATERYDGCNATSVEKN